MTSLLSDAKADPAANTPTARAIAILFIGLPLRIDADIANVLGNVEMGQVTGGQMDTPVLRFASHSKPIIDLSPESPRLVGGVADQLRDVYLEARVVGRELRHLVGQIIDE